ncbi:acyl-protein synthetase [soil metagenome]
MFLDEQAPFALHGQDKARYLGAQLDGLLEHHRARCPAYARLVADWERHSIHGTTEIERYPFVPVTVFKEYDLRSTDQGGMSVRSSSTTGTAAARIFVDKPTRKRQSLSASRILADFIGPGPRPYIVFDLERSVRGLDSMSARGAAILSLSHLASDFFFVMKEAPGGEMAVDRDALDRALAAIGDRPFIAYGFTYILFQIHQQLGAMHGLPAAHAESVLLHSGGWKRMTSIAVDKPAFNRTVAGVWQLPPQRVIDFYGAVEQVGMPYPDCSEGLKHVPYWADVIVRSADSLRPAAPGEPGLIQLINCLPLSCPNHSVLTEDLGEIALEDGCGCGRRGKAFVFRGRAPRAEMRGCSDVGRG